jgi:plastocyanin
MVRVALGVLVALLLAAPAAPAATHTYTLTSEGFELGGFEVELPRVRVPTPPRGGHITYMYARLVDARGRPLPVREVMLHHVLFLNYGSASHRTGAVCPTGDGQSFYGTGEEHEALRLPEGYGYPYEAGDKWVMQAMLMSHRLTATKVFVRYRVAVTTDPVEPVTPFWVRVTGCSHDPNYEVRGGAGAGALDVKSFDWRVPVDGRLVSAGGHLHGGARSLRLTEPACRDRELAGTDPLFGLDDHPVYHLEPLLHEPGPISTQSYLSATGVGVRRGERLRLTATYDGEVPHPQAMGVMHLYIAADRAPGVRCAALPADARRGFLRADSVAEAPLGVPGRPISPRVIVPLNELDDGGHIASIPWPAGSTRPLQSGASIDIRGSRFQYRKISLPVGAKLTWRFQDSALHNVVLANGPWSAGAPLAAYRGRGQRYTTRFPLPGRYQLFCQFHPLTMHQQVLVGDIASR